MGLARSIGEIRKRDGRIVAFDPGKITAAIMKAAQAVQGSDYRLADELAAHVVHAMAADARDGIPTVETIQDWIEKVLIEHGHARTAKAFILYRARRSRIREGKSELMESVGEILQHDGAPTIRSAATISKHMAIGDAASRDFYLNRYLPEAIAEAHLQGDLHIHGLGHYARSPHSVVLPYARLLENGFYSGHGFVRPPRRAGSAAALTSFMLQAAQADCHGGVCLANFDRDLAAILPEKTSPEELDQAMEALLYALNAMTAGPGEPLVRATIQCGLATTALGRSITRALLMAAARGLGRGEPALRPQLVFVLKVGINVAPTDANFDLTHLAAELASKRLQLSFMHDQVDVAYIGHDARLAPSRGLGGVPGQVARVSLNLPRLALRARRDGIEFAYRLEAALRQAALHLAQRVASLATRPVAEFPFLMAQGLWPGAENLDAQGSIGPALTGGTLAIALIGLSETLMVLSGQHHGISPSSHAEGLTLIKFASSLCAELSEEFNLDFVLQAGDAAGVGERFARIDRREFGLIKGVTDGPGYSHGIALPDHAETSADDRLILEGTFIPYFPGGVACLSALATAPGPDAVVAWLQRAVAAGHRMMAVDYPRALCSECGTSGSPQTVCAGCGGMASLARPVLRRRGFLVLGSA